MNKKDRTTLLTMETQDSNILLKFMLQINRDSLIDLQRYVSSMIKRADAIRRNPYCEAITMESTMKVTRARYVTCTIRTAEKGHLDHGEFPKVHEMEVMFLFHDKDGTSFSTSGSGTFGGCTYEEIKDFQQIFDGLVKDLKSQIKEEVEADTPIRTVSHTKKKQNNGISFLDKIRSSMSLDGDPDDDYKLSHEEKKKSKAVNDIQFIDV